MRSLLIVFVILFWPIALFGQAGRIGISVDEATLDCDLTDIASGVATLYVVHDLCPGSSGSRLRLETSPGFTGSLISEIHPFPATIGDAFSGVSITYGACLASPVVLLVLNYQFYGTSSTCSYVRVIAHPLSPDQRIEVWDCEHTPNRMIPHPGGLHVNRYVPPTFYWCPDGDEGDIPGCNPIPGTVPTNASTWGQIKALYE
jgi:hypothetical protein